MGDEEVGGIRWRAVVLGWLVALLAGVVISPLLRLLYGLLGPAERGEFTTAVVVISIVSGFLSYLLGGYVAARTVGLADGGHGALTAVFGLGVGVILTAILTPFGVLFTEGVAVPPACFGFSEWALLAGLALFLTNLFGGYVGGKIGEPYGPDAEGS